ncbi:DUF3300 domain-containing protein [Rahnella sp. AA]|uniref:DUF3300 domain-containing protein n=1 Tax=Rahnella sp. AA TaxID=2057180 RepID=UPI000C33BA34|nr:DUF3300 domain-containing protein [Rahnella sp. AA]PKE32597.1 DUF3300 domain-containing protein [Rahnella sp. AA]
MNLSFKPWGIAVVCSAGAFALASVMFMQGWLPARSQAETTVQTTSPAPPAAAPVVAVPPPATPVTPPAFSQAQLDQWVAPVALYPDSLLSQVLMASTYPTNVIQAVQWSRDHPQSQGDAAVTSVANEPWDPSVKSLVAFPQLLALMGEDPAWVQNLGNAFLAQPDDVMNTVQKFREVAQKSGALKSTPQQTVTVKPKPVAQASSTTSVQSVPAQQTIIIESADPQVVYVPSYNPNVVYGTWATPAYPPVYLPPPPGQQFVNGMASGIGFGVGVAATYAIFGGIDWDDDHHHDDGHHGGSPNNYVNVNVNNYNRISGNNNNAVNHSGSAATQGWQHNPAFNAGAPNYRANLNGATQNQALNNVAQRNNYRGFDGNPGVQNNLSGQTMDQRRQQAASVMNHHEGNLSGATHSATGAASASRAAANLDNRQASGRPLSQQHQTQNLQQHQALNRQQNGNQNALRGGNQQQRQNFHQASNMPRSTAFSGNSSRAPSWQQQQARGNQSRQQMQNFQHARPANAEPVHFHRR